MKLSLRNFRTCRSKVPGSNWAALEAKLRQIEATGNTREMRNATANLDCRLSFDLSRLGSRGQSLPEVKHQFLVHTFFFTNFLLIRHISTILSPLCSSRRDGSNQTPVDLKRSRSKFDLRSEVKLGQSGSCCLSFGSEWSEKHIGTMFICLSYLVQNLTLALVGGGRTDPPPWFFVNNSRKTRWIATKLLFISHWSIWHMF